MYVCLTVLVVLVIFVNGWTDAPNAITCMVSTGSLSYHRAVRLAAVCNLLGILVMSFCNASVASTITGIVRFDGLGPAASAAILCAAMVAIVVFAVTAWFFGIPTSESHALIAALTGAALAQHIPGAVSLSAWYKVLWGLPVSLIAGFALGYLFTKLLGGLLGRGGDRLLDRVQVLSGAGMAFMHGAQDGQKFIAVFVLVGSLRLGHTPAPVTDLRGHLPVMLLCAGVMALGTLTGGKRIIEHVGGRMVRLQKSQGACADLGGAACLLIASLLGIPMSTTHTKTTAIMGAGAAAAGSGVDRGAIRGMLAAWLFTFPVCGAIGYLLAGLFLRLV